MKKISIILSLAALLIFSSISNCFAATTYPSIKSVIDTDYYAYTIYTLYNGEITARVVKSNDKSVIDGVYFIYQDKTAKDLGKISIYSINDITVYQYVLRDGVWASNSTTTITSNTGAVFEDIRNATIYESSKDIVYDTDWANPFFPQTLPLLVTTMEMIAVETPKAGTEVLATMRTILLCGVGCLALLIALPLFSKVFLRYRN